MDINKESYFGTKVNEEIKVKYVRPVSKLEVNALGDWVDMHCGKDIILKKGEFAIIPLGVVIQLPEGFEALLVPRSSTFRRYDIIQTNSIGIIDETYCGENDEWGMPVYATKDTHIPFDARICQFRIISHQPEVVFKEVKETGIKDRGGFGSTGR